MKNDWNSANLEALVIPASVTSLGNYLFNSCTALTSISVSDANTAFRSGGGVLYSKDMTRLNKYPQGNTSASFVIPDGVTAIDNYAVYDCPYLTSVTVPNSVITLGRYTFSGCGALTAINYQGSEEGWLAIVGSSNNTSIPEIEVHYAGETEPLPSLRQGMLLILRRHFHREKLLLFVSLLFKMMRYNMSEDIFRNTCKGGVTCEHCKSDSGYAKKPKFNAG